MQVDVLVWMIVGIALLSSEPFTGSFHLLFIGLSALLTAALAGLGLDYLAVEVVFFVGFSFISVLLLRKRIVRRSTGAFLEEEETELQLEADIAPASEVVLEFQGARWKARNPSSQTLHRGSWVRVTGTNGIQLLLEPAPHGPAAPVDV